MDFSRLTVKASEAVAAASERARAAGNPELNAPHLLLALLAASDSVADRLLVAAGADTAALRATSRPTWRAFRASRAAAAPSRRPAWPSAPCSTARRSRPVTSATSTSPPST
jgi:ATP-dependent Clp protease ATP-binding subunit ClpA